MRLLEIDGLRGYAILTILIRHLVLWDPILPIMEFSPYSSVTLFGVPVFFFISGLVLAYNYRRRKFSIKKFYKRRIFYIGIPYLIWAAVFMIVYKRPFIDLSAVLLEYFYRTASGRWITLWFFIPIFQFYLLFPLLIRLYDSISLTYHKLLVISTFILCLSIYSLHWGFDLYGDHMGRWIPLWSFFGPWVFYFILGMSMGYHWESVVSNLRKFAIFRPLMCIIYVISIILVPFFQQEMGYMGYFTPTTLVLSLLTISFFLIMFSGRTVNDWDHGILKLLKVFGAFSFGIYLSHRPIAVIFGFVMSKSFKMFNLAACQGFLMPILYMVFVPSICMCLVSLLWRTPLGSFIIGRYPRKKRV